MSEKSFVKKYVIPTKDKFVAALSVSQKGVIDGFKL